jgi:hypothetical protein
VGPRVGPDVVAKRKILPSPESNPGRIASTLVEAMGVKVLSRFSWLRIGPVTGFE